VERNLSPDDAVRVIADAFASEGAQDYLGEPVTQAAHMLQAAALAERDGASDALIAAALLHDVGHFIDAVSGRHPGAGPGTGTGAGPGAGPGTGAGPGARSGTGPGADSGADRKHQESGASWLAQWFGPEVTEPVRLHVAAKRYLCAAEPEYAAVLSPASVASLNVQGGAMQQPELTAFEAEPHAAAAIRVRRWDDAAKDPDAPVPSFDHFRPLLLALVRAQPPG
jgi:predicted HD phosphohydrolase